MGDATGLTSKKRLNGLSKIKVSSVVVIRAIPNFQPGQFLTIKLSIPGQEKPVIRTYSLSDCLDPWEYYRLSIKRESAPKGLDVRPGIASNFRHDQVNEGR